MTVKQNVNSLNFTSDFRNTNVAVSIVLAVWLAAILLLGNAGTFAVTAGHPPLPIAIGLAVPIFFVYFLYRQNQIFRNWVLNIPPVLIASLMAWRFVGFEFIGLYVHDILPGFFALPAGIGDMFMGITAPWVALKLVRQPDFSSSRYFVVWNLIGIMDLVLALALGITGALIATGAVGEISTAPVSHLPLVIIPVYLVPLLLMLHITALLQAWKKRQNNRK